MFNSYDFFYRWLGLRVFSWLRWRLFPVSSALHDKPYSTHIPVLTGLAAQWNIRRVLELGTGDFSTGLFLNRDLFPSLESLDSFEDDATWAKKMTDRFGHDPRFHLHLSDTPVHLAIGQADLTGYDLVFIDDSTNAASRSQTIATVMKKLQPGCMAVIHDFEVGDYRQAIGRNCHHYTISVYTPCTGLVWKTSLTGFAPQKIRSILRKNRDRFLTTDAESWRNVFIAPTTL